MFSLIIFSSSPKEEKKWSDNDKNDANDGDYRLIIILSFNHCDGFISGFLEFAIRGSGTTGLYLYTRISKYQFD